MLDFEKLGELDEIFQKAVADGAAPGMNVAIMTKNEKWIKSYGHRQQVPTEEKNTLDTIWDLASISKVLVTTTCILKLIEEGSLTLQTKLQEVLPNLNQKDITILDCITHSSGLPADIEGYKTMTQEEMIAAALQIEKDPAWVGKVHYSDVNFILLGMVIAKLKGSLDGYAEEVMFKPLQMFNTTYRPKASLKARCAAYEDQVARGGVVKGEVHDGKAYKLGGVSGHAGVFSTIEDITHYVEMLLNEGVYHGIQFFNQTTMTMLKTCYTAGMNERRSIGWILSDSNYALGQNFSEHTLYHTGFSGPSMMIDLDRGLGCVVLCNRVHPSRENKLILEVRNTIHDAAYQCLKGE